MTAPNDNSVPLPARIGGKYRPLRLIGRGGMGAVYEVEHEHTGQRLALKVIASTAGLTGGALERFRMEARAAGRIRSDHVVRITDADVAPELDRAPFIVMELLEGADLETVTGGAPASAVDVVAWLRQVALGLAKAHALGVVHRDLKPENIFLTQRDDGTPLVKILDFGVAKVIEEGAAQTRSGQLVGTPLYMAPEQAGSSEGISPRTDGFALGLIAFKLLVGHVFWKSGTILQLVSQLTLEPMLPASERGATFGPGFDAWFARACARDPSLRFEEPHEQIEALAEVFGMERVGASSATRSRRPIVAENASLATAQTLAASGNLVISSSTSAARKGRTAAAALGTMGLVVVVLLLVAVIGSRRGKVVAGADGASILSSASGSVGAQVLPAAPTSGSSPALASANLPNRGPVLDGGARVPDARATKSGAHGFPHRDPLEDQN
jgi:eukaryotic-like serine/threonine-protein kinase